MQFIYALFMLAAAVPSFVAGAPASGSVGVTSHETETQRRGITARHLFDEKDMCGKRCYVILGYNPCPKMCPECSTTELSPLEKVCNTGSGEAAGGDPIKAGGFRADDHSPPSVQVGA